MAKYILFDLDGTLTDPKVGITKSVQYALSKFGIEVNDPNDLCHFIGPPLRESFMAFYSFAADEAEEAVEKYREYFAETGIFENEIFPGTEEMLKELKEEGKILIIATSKPTVYAKKTLEHFNIDTYFSFVSGSELDGRRSKKSELIKYALDNINISDLNEVIMVGDREHDIIGAKEIGIMSIGVLHGYGSHKELSNAGADIIVRDIKMLKETLSRFPYYHVVS